MCSSAALRVGNAWGLWGSWGVSGRSTKNAAAHSSGARSRRQQRSALTFSADLSRKPHHPHDPHGPVGEGILERVLRLFGGEVVEGRPGRGPLFRPAPRESGSVLQPDTIRVPGSASDAGARRAAYLPGFEAAEGRPDHD